MDCHAQYEVRLKTVGYNLLYGKKASLQLTKRWIGDELGREDHNPNAAEFIEVVSYAIILIIY